MNLLKTISISLITSLLTSSFAYLLLHSDWLSIILFLITFGITALVSQKTLAIKSAQQQNIGLRDIAFTTNKIKQALHIKEKFNNIKRQRLSTDKNKLIYDIIMLCDNIFNKIEQQPLLYYGNELFFLEELPLAENLIEHLLSTTNIEAYKIQVQQLISLLQERQQTVLNGSELDEHTALALLQERTKKNQQKIKTQQKIKQR